MPDSQRIMTIGRLASAAGVRQSTIRYYEREDLLKPTSRSPHGYRQYDRVSLERLRFIRAAQAAGFSLNDIKSLLRLREHDASACERVCDLADARLEQVSQQLADLRQVQRALRDARQSCAERATPETCAILDQLDSAARSAKDTSPEQFF